jgi:hypothetical protein
MSQSDARIQSAVLLLLVEWARDCDHALIAWFATYFFCFDCY